MVVNYWTTAVTIHEIVEDVLFKFSIRLYESFEGIVALRLLYPFCYGASCFFFCVLCFENMIQIFSVVT